MLSISGMPDINWIQHGLCNTVIYGKPIKIECRGVGRYFVIQNLLKHMIFCDIRVYAS